MEQRRECGSSCGLTGRTAHHEAKYKVKKRTPSFTGFAMATQKTKTGVDGCVTVPCPPKMPQTSLKMCHTSSAKKTARSGEAKSRSILRKASVEKVGSPLSPRRVNFKVPKKVQGPQQQKHVKPVRNNSMPSSEQKPQKDSTRSSITRVMRVIPMRDMMVTSQTKPQKNAARSSSLTHLNASASFTKPSQATSTRSTTRLMRLIPMSDMTSPPPETVFSTSSSISSTQLCVPQRASQTEQSSFPVPVNIDSATALPCVP